MSGDTQFDKTIDCISKPFNLCTHAVMMTLSQVTIGHTSKPFNPHLFCCDDGIITSHNRLHIKAFQSAGPYIPPHHHLTFASHVRLHSRPFDLQAPIPFPSCTWTYRTYLLIIPFIYLLSVNSIE